ncbi:MAG: hypothetical protein J6A75_11820 [Lachnospiraceae bacterium]|nr:hypothetical protein [Lachnospiraceae bacterium]
MKKSKITGWIIIMFLVISISMTGYAAETKEKLHIPLDAFHAGEDVEDGYQLEMDYGKEQENLHISFQTDGKEEGEYPVSVFENVEEVFKGYSGISFDIFNQGQEVKMNMLFSTKEEHVFVLEDGVDVVLYQDNTCNVQTVEYGAFSIPKDFKGSIYIPFNSFTGGEKAKNKELKRGIYGLGFTFVVPENAKVRLLLSSLCVLPDEDVKTAAYFQIVGDKSVLRPALGKSYADYEVKFYNRKGKAKAKPQKITYELTKDGQEAKGITIDDTGHLVAEPAAEEGIYLLKAYNPKGVFSSMEIELKKSWTETQKTDNGYDASVVSPDLVTEIVSKDSILMNEKFFEYVRMMAVIGSVIFLTYYYLRHRKAKEQFKKEFLEEGK